jgi:predicted aldo/keto reductase-like oxidoreductase
MGQRGINRREFVIRSAAGLMAAGMGLHPARVRGAEPTKSPKIVYRTLGRTKLRIPLVSFGVMNSDSPDLIHRALDLGINHLDTAHVYLRGNSEKTIGKILAERGDRDKVHVATKMLFNRDKEKNVFAGQGRGKYAGATANNFHKQLAKSLKRLRTDYVDILYLHSCHGAGMSTYEPMLKLFVKAKESGHARFIGVSTHANEAETIRAAVDTGVWDVILTSYNFLQNHRDEVKEAIQYATDRGVGVIAMKTQGGVRLNREKKVEVNHAAALKWVLQDHNVCTTIPGITTFDQLQLDVGVMSSLSLSEEEKRDLKISSLVRGHLYCQQCRRCIPSCSRNVEIPTLMRAFMYAAGYGNLAQAQLTVDGVPPERGLSKCRDCPSCTATCRNGIDVRERLEALRAIG